MLLLLLLLVVVGGSSRLAALGRATPKYKMARSLPGTELAPPACKTEASYTSMSPHWKPPPQAERTPLVVEPIKARRAATTAAACCCCCSTVVVAPAAYSGGGYVVEQSVRLRSVRSGHKIGRSVLRSRHILQGDKAHQSGR